MRQNFRMFDGTFGPDAMMALRVFWGIMLVALFLALAISVVFLVFRGLGLQRMAKRKNIPHGWMGYVPVLNLYLLGKVSNMPDKRRRSEIVMLVLGILSVLSAVICLAYLVPIMEAVVKLAENPRLNYSAADMISLVWGIVLTCFVSGGFAIARDVIKYIALHRVYRQFSPDNATMMTVFTVLAGVLIAPISPFLLFAVRNNEIWPMGKPPAGSEAQYPPNIPKFEGYAYDAAAAGVIGAAGQNEPPQDDSVPPEDRN